MNAQPITPQSDDPSWYKDAVIYQLHLKSFFDADNDGIGDFNGLIEKLDYIAELGVTAIWMLPFYPSPRRDDGYDIADYRGVHPDYGTPAISTRGSSGPAPHLPGRRSAISTYGPMTIKNMPARALFSSIPKNPTGHGTRWPAPTTGTASTRINPT
jgi:hypothetical protein